MTKSSPGRRERRLKHKHEPKRGRPRGTFASLLKDPQRFPITAWHVFEPALGPHVAARLAIVLVEENMPISIETLEDLFVVSSTYMPPPGTQADLDDRARDLAAKARLATSRATEDELAWLTASSGALRALIAFMAEENWAGAQQALELLRHVGWGGVLARAGRRFGIALEAENLRPFDKSRLRAAGRRLLEAMRQKKATKP
jgi:hypothetical protein